MSENPHNNNSNRRNDETLDCIPPGVLVPDFPLVVLYEFVLLLLQSVRLFVREEEEEESASVAELIKEETEHVQLGTTFLFGRRTRPTNERPSVLREQGDARDAMDRTGAVSNVSVGIRRGRVQERRGDQRGDFADFETFAVFDAVRKRSRVQGVGGRERRFI